MSFRRTRKSSDGYSWLTVALSLGGAIGCGAVCVGAFVGESLSAKVFTLALFVLFGIAFVFSLRGILFPYEWELVAEGEFIRWGEAAKPQRQRRVFMPSVKRIIHDKPDSKVLADIGSWRLLPVGDYILMRTEDQAALVEHLRRSFPSLKIETT